MDSSSSDSEEDEYETDLSQLKTVLGKPLFTEGYMLAKKDSVVPQNLEKKGSLSSQTSNTTVQDKKK